MKKVFYTYNIRANEGWMEFSDNATIEEIAWKLGVNAIITKVEPGE